MTDTIDSKIYQLLEVLEAKKKDVSNAEKEAGRSWVTNCSLPLWTGTTLNLQTASTENLVHAVSLLLMLEESQRKAAEVLGVSAGKLYHGYKIEDWIEDCKKRIAKVELNQKKSELATLESRLNAIVSPEQRRAMELEALTKALT